MKPIGNLAQSVLKDTCREMLDTSRTRKQRPVMTSEVREVVNLYLNDSTVTVAEIAARLNRPKQTIYNILDSAGVSWGRQPFSSDKRPGIDRRNAKIVEAILSGDNMATVARRWGISERSVMYVLREFQRRTRMSTARWRALFPSC